MNHQEEIDRIDRLIAKCERGMFWCKVWIFVSIFLIVASAVALVMGWWT